MKKIILSILTIAAMATSVNAQIPTAGLVGHYDFTNGALTDNINSVNFTKTGAASTNITDRFGNVNEAISLNGDDLIRPDIDFNLTSSNPYLERTISFWMKTSTNDGNVRLIYNDNSRITVGAINYNGLIVYLQNGQVKASNRVGSNGNLVTHSTAVSDNNWHHVAIQGYSTTISGTKRFYTYVFIDGAKEGGNGYQSSASGLSVTANEYIGDLGFSRLASASLSSTQKYLDGLDEVLIYTRVLADFEVNNITTNNSSACTVNIPDANFKAYLVGNTAINTNGDTEIQCTEATAFTGAISCDNQSISDLTGIEAFTGLTSLNCQANTLTSLNVSQNIALMSLKCGINSLTNLSVSNNTALTTLWLYDNLITSIDVSNNSSLEFLSCWGNGLTNINVSLNTALTRIYCQNNALTSLNIANGNNHNFISGVLTATGNPNLTCVQVDNVSYSTTNWPNGIDATASYSTNCNPPCTVNIPDANFKAYLVGNALINTNGNTEIECSEATAFTGIINCSNLSISDLTGIEAFTALTELYCSNNSLTSLDVTQNTALTDLGCGANALSSLDVTQNTALTLLYCQVNSISSLDVTQNTTLTKLLCQGNSLSSLDVTQNTALTRLLCGGSSLTSLDVSNNTSLTELDCGSSLLSSLDVTQNTVLTKLYCNQNSLTTLNVANGNNSNFVSFFANNNPNLTCITVDNVAYSTTNWTIIDAGASFSLSCGTIILVNSITVQGQGGVSTITTAGGTLQMEATVLPANADDATYTWSVMDGSGTATIDVNGLLTALTDGTVSVIAVANDASSTAGTKTITISNQSVGVNEVALQKVNIYPNPVKNQLFIELDNQGVTEMLIIDYSGRVVKTIMNNSVNSIDVADLTQGIYVLKISTKNGVLTNSFIKK